MSFHEVQFPTNIAYGSSGGPGFEHGLIVTDSGQEGRFARLEHARHKFAVDYVDRSRADMALIRSFYIARQGPANGFRHKDWNDFTSNADGISAPTDTDQVATPVTSPTSVHFQMKKKYTDITRTILKPVAGTVVVAKDGTPQATGWTVNTTTGIITFTTSVGDSVEVTAGFEFDVPVRFGSDIDELLSASLDEYDTVSSAQIPMIEVMEPELWDGEYHNGGGSAFNLTASMTLARSDGRAISLLNQDALHTVFLPSLGSMQAGGPHFYLRLDSASTANVVIDNGTGDLINSTIVVMEPGDILELLIVQQTGGGLTWFGIGGLIPP